MIQSLCILFISFHTFPQYFWTKAGLFWVLSNSSHDYLEWYSIDNLRAVATQFITRKSKKIVWMWQNFIFHFRRIFCSENFIFKKLLFYIKMFFVAQVKNSDLEKIMHFIPFIRKELQITRIKIKTSKQVNILEKNIF